MEDALSVCDCVMVKSKSSMVFREVSRPARAARSSLPYRTASCKLDEVALRSGPKSLGELFAHLNEAAEATHRRWLRRSARLVRSWSRRFSESVKSSKTWAPRSLTTRRCRHAPFLAASQCSSIVLFVEALAASTFISVIRPSSTCSSRWTT